MAEITQERIPNGPAAAAILSAGVGSATIGLMTTGAVISAGLKSALNWWSPAGPLTGKTGVSVIAWLVTWIVLHVLWKDKGTKVKVARKPALPPHIGSVTASAPQDMGVRWRFRPHHVLLLPQCG